MLPDESWYGYGQAHCHYEIGEADGVEHPHVLRHFWAPYGEAVGYSLFQLVKGMFWGEDETCD